MAEQHQAGTISAAFPAPPPFYKYFTSENLTRLEEIRFSNNPPLVGRSSDELPKSPPPFDLNTLPPELRYLIPPPPPTDQYSSFATLHTLNPEPAASTPDPRRLKDIVRSLLLHFLSLIHSLATEPKDYAPKWDNLRDLLFQAHGVINEYRPHQARESLIEMMEQQMKRGREEIRICRETEERVREALREVGGAGRKIRR